MVNLISKNIHKYMQQFSWKNCIHYEIIQNSMAIQ